MSNELPKLSPELPILGIDTFPNTLKYTPKHNPVPIELMIDLRKKGLSYSQMAKVLGLSKQACNQRLRPLYATLELADSFKKCKSEVLNYKQSRLLSSVDDEAIKGMSPYQRIVAASILYDKQRLEDNLSSSNVSIRSMSEEIKSKLIDLDKLSEMLGVVEGGNRVVESKAPSPYLATENKRGIDEP